MFIAITAAAEAASVGEQYNLLVMHQFTHMQYIKLFQNLLMLHTGAHIECRAFTVEQQRFYKNLLVLQFCGETINYLCARMNDF